MFAWGSKELYFGHREMSLEVDPINQPTLSKTTSCHKEGNGVEHENQAFKVSKDSNMLFNKVIMQIT